MKLLIATRNPGKLKEMRALLGDLPVELATLDAFPNAPDVVEDGATLEENAAKKATEIARACRLHVVADDSGLFVDALDGRPGVRSARYAGPDPTPEKLCARLLQEMAGVPEERRAAHFRCCIVMVEPQGRVLLTADGRVDGCITGQMRGQGGFGYDPVFFYEPEGRTFAEMSATRKNAFSHRGRALLEFRRKFDEHLKSGREG